MSRAFAADAWLSLEGSDGHLEIYFQAPERNGFKAITLGDGSGNEKVIEQVQRKLHYKGQNSAMRQAIPR